MGSRFIPPDKKSYKSGPRKVDFTSVQRTEDVTVVKEQVTVAKETQVDAVIEPAETLEAAHQPEAETVAPVADEPVLVAPLKVPETKKKK
jgi:hypothetical protein